MQRFSIQSGILLLSFLSVSLWEKSTFAVYTIPLLAILTTIYVITTFRKKASQIHENSKKELLIAFLLNTSTLLLIQTTGGLNSFLFFLLYFLCFYIAFTLIPESVFIFTVAILLLFVPEISTGNTLLNVTKLLSFLLLSPLAYFFGKAISAKDQKEKEVSNLRSQTKEKAEKIIEDVEVLVKNEGEHLKEEDIEKLKDIIDQSRELEKEA